MGKEFICFEVAVPHVRRTSQNVGPLFVPSALHKSRRTFDVLFLARSRPFPYPTKL